MMTVTSNINNTSAYQEIQSQKKGKVEASFEETLNQTQNTTNSKAEEMSQESKEAHFKHVERFSYEFIKNCTVEELENSYNDLEPEEQDKIKTLKGFSNMSDNEILNKVLFEKAETMSPKEARDLSFQTASEMYHYKRRGIGQRFIYTADMFEPQKNSLNSTTNNGNSRVDEYRLSHNQAFDFLRDMVSSSKDGMNNKNITSEVR